jgi:branched-chain amino acid transport system substrate-binding protein
LPVKGRLARSLTLTKGGLWAVTFDNKAILLDNRFGRVKDKIPLTVTGLNDVAFGAGAVWALDPADGTLWKILPGRNPTSSTITVGAGAHAVAFGAGSVWVANGFDGTVLKIDPATGRIVKINVGGVPRAITVGDGLVWVTIGTSTGLRSSNCGPILKHGSARPDYLITSDLPYRYRYTAVTDPAVASIELVLRQHSFRAGRFTIGYQSCDDSIEAGGVGPSWDAYSCAANTRSFAADPRVIGMIGPFNSGCAKVEIPIANRASLPMISPSNTWPGLTKAGPSTSRGEPGIYYPTGVRTYFRVSPSESDEAASDAIFAKQLGAKRVFVLYQGSPGDYGTDIAGYFKRAALRLGLSVAGFAPWVENVASYRRLVSRIAKTRPDAVFLGGEQGQTEGNLLKQLRSKLGRRVAIIVPDGFTGVEYPGYIAHRQAGTAAFGLYLTVDWVGEHELPAAARRFLSELRQANSQTITQNADYHYAPYTAQATDALIAAIAHSNGTRASVVRELHQLQFNNVPLGSFHFDSNGDPTLHQTSIEHVVKQTPPSSDTPGAITIRVLNPPSKLTKEPLVTP